MDLSLITIKKCARCKLLKDKSEFAKQARSLDGRQSWCKTCRKDYRKENRQVFIAKDRQRYRDNPEPFKEAGKKRRERLGKEKIREYNQAYAAANKEKISKIAKSWRERNSEKLKAYRKKRYQENKQKYYERNLKKWLEMPHVVLEACRRRTAMKRQAVPAWANQEKIKEAYLIAELLTKILKISYQVDHIVPLKSKFVCGLHVEHNLQVITASENAAKGNRWWPGKP